MLRACRGYAPDEKGDCTAHRECIETRYSDGRRRIKAKNQLTADELRKIYVL